MTTAKAAALADPLALLSRHAIAAAEAGDAAFVRATPFGHCVIDGFFEDAFARRLLDEFPAFEHGNRLNEDGTVGGKSTSARIAALGGAFQRLDACVRSPAWPCLNGPAVWSTTSSHRRHPQHPR